MINSVEGFVRDKLNILQYLCIYVLKNLGLLTMSFLIIVAVNKSGKFLLLVMNFPCFSQQCSSSLRLSISGIEIFFFFGQRV